MSKQIARWWDRGWRDMIAPLQRRIDEARALVGPGSIPGEEPCVSPPFKKGVVGRRGDFRSQQRATRWGQSWCHDHRFFTRMLARVSALSFVIADYHSHLQSVYSGNSRSTPTIDLSVTWILFSRLVQYVLQTCYTKGDQCMACGLQTRILRG